MSTARTSKSYSDQLVEIIEKWRSSHPGAPFNMDDIADWAFDEGYHDIMRTSAKKELKRNLTKAARRKKIRDAQGRSVRAFHAAKFQRTDDQGNLVFDAIWDHINDMSFDHAALSFIDGRRGQLAGGCKSLKNDIDSFNDNNPNASGSPIQISFDFTYDIEEDEEDEGETPNKPR